jgi:large subunit ribosomal protein L10
MNRKEKQLVIDEVRNDFEQSQASFLIGVEGMTVHDLQGLRKGLYEKGARLKVAKNTLLKIATQDLQGLNELAPHFKDQIAIVFAKEETPEVAKIIFNISKANERLKIVAGALDKKVINKSEIEFLAALPSREVLLAQVCGTLKAPISGLVSVLNQLILRPLWVLKQISEKK